MARIVELIITEDRRGSGRDHENPIRLIPELYTKDGALIAWHDAFTGESWVNGDALRELSVRAQDILRDDWNSRGVHTNPKPEIVVE